MGNQSDVRADNRAINRALLFLLFMIGFVTMGCAQQLPEEHVTYEEASQAYRRCHENAYPSDTGSACDLVRPANSQALSFNEWASGYEGPSYAHPGAVYSPTEVFGFEQYMALQQQYERYLNSLDSRTQYDMASQWGYMDPYAGYYY